MPAREFRLPDLGEGVKEGQIIRVLVSEGEDVTEDQPLLEVETDKAAVEIPCPFTGRVTGVHVVEQQEVNVGDVMVTVEVAGAAVRETEPKPAAAAATAAAGATIAAPAARAGAAPPGRRKAASPAVRKLARSMGVDLDTVSGSGPGGRVTRSDVEKVAAGGGVPAAPVPSVAPTTVPRPTAPIVAAPPPQPNLAPIEPAGTDDVDTWGPIRRQPLSRARRTIAKHMSTSVSTIPHVTDHDDADITELDRLRRGYAAQDGSPRKLTMLPFVIRAVARALQRFPEFNARFDEEAGEVVYLRYFSIAIGVHTERGLIAPVLRNADQLGIQQISDDLAVIAENARSATFEVNDTRGGTFTISNAGAMGGSRYSSPIINHPQVAILALGRSRVQPWVVNGEVTPRLIMPMSLAFDHRLIDGAQEVAFMQHVIGDLEHPARMLL